MLENSIRRAGFRLAASCIVLGCFVSQVRADLVLRLDASDASALALNGTMLDGWGQSFGQTSIMGDLLPLDVPPTFNPTGLNGLGTVEFSAAANPVASEGTVMAASFGNFIDAGAANGNQYSIFFVASQAAGVRGTAFSHSAGYRGGGFAFRNGANNFAYRRGSFSKFTDGNVDFAVRSVVSPDATNLVLGVNGVEAPANPAVTDHVPLNNEGLFMLGGRDLAGNRDPFTGSIAEIAIFNTALDIDTRTGINHVLADKWGLPAVAATPEQIALAIGALTQPFIEPPPPPEPIALYEFATSLDLSPTDVGPFFSASDIASGGAELGSSSLGEPGRSLFLGRDLGGGILIPTWEEASEVGPQTASADYLEFTVSPNGSLPLSVGALTFALHRRDSDSLNSYALYADEDPGAGGDNFTTKIAGDTTSAISAGNFETIFADLESVGFLTNVSEATTFRLYLWHDGPFAGSGAGLTRIDNVTLTAFVPEPSTVCLVIVGLLGLVSSVRRRRG